MKFLTLVSAVITGAFLVFIATVLGQGATFFPAPYNQYVMIISAIILAVTPILVNGGIIPALRKFGGLGFAITGAVFTFVAALLAEASVSVSASDPALGLYLKVASLIVASIGQILVANGIIPALRQV